MEKTNHFPAEKLLFGVDVLIRIRRLLSDAGQAWVQTARTQDLTRRIGHFACDSHQTLRLALEAQLVEPVVHPRPFA